MNLIGLAGSFDWSVLGLTLLHFCWQGAVIGIVTLLILALMRARPASWRYLTSCLAMITCLLSLLITFSLLMKASSPSSIDIESALVSDRQADAPTIGKLVSGVDVLPQSNAMESTTPALGVSDAIVETIALLWCVGFLFMAIRFLIHWRVSRRVCRTKVGTPDATWCRLFDALKHELKLSPGIRLLRSGLVQTPMVVGWFSPVVLVPAEAFTNLSREQLRLVMLHELHHIRRLDPLVNLVQCILECLLFFHPVTWWLSRQIRVERENCCDDCTLEHTKQPLILAEALFILESLRARQVNTLSIMMLHATGGTLMTRVSRILKMDPATTGNGLAWRTPLALLLASGIVAAACVTNLTNEATAENTELAAQDRGQDRGARAESSSEEFPSEEAVMQRIKRGLEGRRITPEQADQIKSIYRRFAMGVESGRLSSEEAAAMFRERVSKAMEPGETKQENAPQSDEKTRASHMAAVMLELGKALESGRITPEEALKHVMIEAKRMQIGVGEQEPTPAEQRQRRAKYAEAEKKMAAMVEEGEITREQMEQRLEGMKRRMAGEMSPKLTKQDYAEAEKKMAAMVEKGEITREAMAQRLGEMKRAMAGEETPKITKQDYAEAEKKMAAMVEKGEITREQMEQRLGEMKRIMMASDGQKRQRVTRQDYAEAQKKMEAMVEAGEMTREQMQERLDVMRRMMAE